MLPVYTGAIALYLLFSVVMQCVPNYEDTMASHIKVCNEVECQN